MTTNAGKADNLNDEGVNSNMVIVYPNPVKTQFNLRFNTGKTGEVLDLNLKDINGNIVRNQQSIRSSSQITVNVSGLPSGLYILQLSSGKEVIAIRKIIIEK